MPLTLGGARVLMMLMGREYRRGDTPAIRRWIRLSQTTPRCHRRKNPFAVNKASVPKVDGGSGIFYKYASGYAGYGNTISGLI